MTRAAVFCPGRGSYGKRQRRSLPEEHPWIDRADALREEYGLGSLRALDSAKWNEQEHLRPDNASPLIYLVTMIDVESTRAEHEACCIGGNSMGWYTALAGAGALSFEDGFRLVQEMALLQMEQAEGGQILYPLVDGEWRIDPAQLRRVERALQSSGGEAFPSIALGGYVVLAGTEVGVRHLLDALPVVEMGPSLFPYRLKQHGPYHTPLQRGVAQRAREQLARLSWRAPEVTLIDGRGAQFTPWSTDPAALAEYTLGAQIAEPFGFTTTVRVALREYAPDLVVLPGPGNTLGGICGQVLVMEGYRGIRSRDDFERIQASDRPAIWSRRR